MRADEFFEYRVFNTRGHDYKLYKKRNNNNARTNFFAERIVNVWNRLPSEIVNFDTLPSFNRTVKLVDLSQFLKSFWVLFILKGQRFVQFNSALFTCSPIVISILTFMH